MSAAAESAYAAPVLQPNGRILELAAWCALPASATADWPTQAGEVRCDVAGEPVLLHFAPGRWLVTATGPATDAALAQLGTCAAVVDVTGKWRALRIAGAGALSLLDRTLDSDGVLAGRQCAAVTLFDCPAVLARGPGGYRAWVQSSYLAHFLALAASDGGPAAP